MKKAIIFLNGEYNYSPNFINKLIDENSDCYCADGGANYIFKYNKIPKLIVGDLDSIKQETLSFFTKKNVTINKYPPEKDFTDFELIMKKIEEFELKNGKYERKYVLGGLGGRIDMSLNNLHLSEKYQNLIFLSSNKNKIEEIFYTENTISIQNKKNCTFSIILLDEIIKKLTLKGFKYEIENVDIERKFSRLVSNEIISNNCCVEFEKGKILIYLSSDEENFFNYF